MPQRSFFRRAPSPSRPTAFTSIFHLLTLQVLATALLLPILTTRAEDPTSTPAQRTAPFVDQSTGLPMERFFGARTSFAFAMALPTDPASTSFIGQLSFPLGTGGVGYGAMGFTGDMEGNFILAAWPDGAGGVMASFRQATDEDNPPEVAGKFKVRPIASATVVNATALTYTFLCENCLDSALGLGPAETQGDRVMGWALSQRAIRGQASDPGVRLAFHERGFGPFTARLGSARTAQFEAVAALAGQPVAASSRAVAATPGVAGGDGKGGGDDSGDESDDDD